MRKEHECPNLVTVSALSSQNILENAEHRAVLHVSCENMCLWPHYKIWYHVLWMIHCSVFPHLFCFPSWGMIENGRQNKSVKPFEVSLNKWFINPEKWIPLERGRMPWFLSLSDFSSQTEDKIVKNIPVGWRKERKLIIKSNGLHSSEQLVQWFMI